MRLKYFHLAFIPFFMSPVIAADQDVRKDAIGCAALYYIMTSLPNQDPRYGQAMTSLGQMMTAIYSVHENKVTGKRVLNGDVIRLRDTKAEYFGELYDESPNTVVDEYMFCNKWREAIAKYVSKQGQGMLTTENKNEMEKFMLNIPKPQDRKNLNLQKNDNVKKAIDLSFKSWTENGRPTPTNVNKKLKKIIDKE